MSLNLNGLQNTNEGPKTSLNLSKGMSLDLSKHANLKHLRVGLGWSAGRPGEMFDLDASALLLNTSNRVTDNSDVIFYNQKDTGRGVVSMGDNRTGSTGNDDDETILIDTTRVPQNTDSIKIIVTIDKAKERQQTFGSVRNAYIRLVNDDTNEELCRYVLNEEAQMQTAFEMAELRREGSSWEFKALGNGFLEELGDVLVRHGVS